MKVLVSLTISVFMILLFNTVGHAQENEFFTGKIINAPDLSDTFTQEEPDLFKKTFGNEYESNKDYIDVEIHDWAIEQCRKKNLFEQKVTEFTELLNEVEKEHLVIIPVDWNRLKNKIGTYQGHYVVICGIDANYIFLHDPDEGPYIKYPIKVVKNAWEHPAIADDYIVALGKK